MEIVKILRGQETDKETFTEITFKTWWGKKITEVCITPFTKEKTFYAKDGSGIPINLWNTVSSFLRTDEKSHYYGK